MSELIDNSRQRVATLTGIIRELHAGAAPGDVKARLAALVRETTSEEIVAMEQQLMTEGMTVEEIKGMCDLHAQVMGDLLDERTLAQLTPGHPVHTFQAENAAIGALVREIRAVLTDLVDGSGSDLAATVARWRALHERLLEVEKHYARKENILFPHLERHGVTGPSQVMWGKDDDIRMLLRTLREALGAEGATRDEWRLVVREIAEPLLEQVEGMIVKEEQILLPMALKKLSPEEWGEIFRDALRFGWCLVEPGRDYAPPPLAAPESTVGEAAAAARAGAAAVPVGVGSLTPAQLAALFRTLPVDLTVVDADDRVVFFSEGEKRIFDRSAAIIGRRVQNCHPPHSVSVVERILADFRSGVRDQAEFWIDFRGRFVHINYFALRDERGVYLGTLEVTQDVSRARSLTGERRLLEEVSAP